VGFPNTVKQYQLLETAMSGYVAPALRPKSEATLKKEEVAKLAPGPEQPSEPEPLFEGAVGLHILLETTNSEVVRRVAGKRVDPVTNLEYHLEDDPPPEQEQVIYERLVPVDHDCMSNGILVDRLHQFDVHWVEMEQFLQHLGTSDAHRLIKVSEATEDRVFELVEPKVAELYERKRAEWEAQQLSKKSRDRADTKGAVTPLSEVEVEAEGEEGEEVAGEEEIVPVFTLQDLAPAVKKLERRVKHSCMERWDELSSAYTDGMRAVMAWQRRQRQEVARGFAAVQQNFVQFVSREDDRQDAVDAFVKTFNDFVDEFPDMLCQDSTKEELHLKADDLAVTLTEKTEARRVAGLQRHAAIVESGWLEAQFQSFAIALQRLVQLEFARYHHSCGILVDLYYAVMGEPLPPPSPPPERLDVMAPLDPATLPPPAKGEPPPSTDPPPVRAWVEPVVDAEGHQTAPGYWTYPMHGPLFDKARGLVKKFDAPPGAAPKEPADPKAKGAAKDKKGTAAEPEEVKKPTHPAFNELQQALLTASVQYEERLHCLQCWSQRELEQLSSSSGKIWSNLQDFVTLRFEAETAAVRELTSMIKDQVEAEGRFECDVTLDMTKLVHHPNTLLYEPIVPEVPPVCEAPTATRLMIPKLYELLDGITAAAEGSLFVPVASVVALLNQTAGVCEVLGTTAEAFVAELTPPGGAQVDGAELLLHLGLARMDAWPVDETYRVRFQEWLQKLGAGNAYPDFWMDEATFMDLPLFTPEMEHAELEAQKVMPGKPFPRTAELRRWLFKAFQAFPVASATWERTKLQRRWDRAVYPAPPPPPPPEESSRVVPLDWDEDSQEDDHTEPSSPNKSARQEGPDAGLYTIDEDDSGLGVSLRRVLGYLCAACSDPLAGMRLSMAVMAKNPDSAVPVEEFYDIVHHMGVRPAIPDDPIGCPAFDPILRFAATRSDKGLDVATFAGGVEGARWMAKFGHRFATRVRQPTTPKTDAGGSAGPH